MGDRLLDSLIPKINKLAHKEKSQGLTSEEKAEQKDLRHRYLKRFRANFRDRLLHTKFVDKKGNDITSNKVKKYQKQHGYRK